MISVCMATYNGSKYIREQIDSILPQLSENDELIISDDHSTDCTLKIIQSYKDTRIKIFENELEKGVTHNFENALLHSKGDIIFLADQDDVWLPNKLNKMKEILIYGQYNIVLSNCSMTDLNLNIIKKEYYDENWPMEKSLIANIYKCACLGSCLAFTRQTLNLLLPFPKHIILHDLWIFLFCIANLKVGYIREPLMLYRRHQNTVTFAGRKSENSLFTKIKFRIYAIVVLIQRTLNYRIHKYNK